VDAGGPKQVVDSLYMAQFNHLNDVAEDARRKNVQAKSEQGSEPGAKLQKTKDEEQLITQIGDGDETARQKQKQQDKERRKKQGQPDVADDTAEEVAPGAAAAKSLGLERPGGRYLDPGLDERLGDPELSDPGEMKRVLGPSVRFAQHAMMLAEAQLSEGATRQDALAYLAKLYLGCPDRAYAMKACREFGPATGILSLYPLELVEHLLETNPGFLPKVSKGSFFVNPGKIAHYTAKTGEPIALEYAPGIKIRGFAVRGGAKVGYLFEPGDALGTYRLTFATAGRFEFLVSALDPKGSTVIETLVAEIAPGGELSLERFTDKRPSSAPNAPSAPNVPAAASPAPQAPAGAARPSTPPSPGLRLAFPRRA
jgi:hypothetical protein